MTSSSAHDIRAYWDLVREIAKSPDRCCDLSRCEIEAILKRVGKRAIDLSEDVDDQIRVNTTRRRRLFLER